MLETRHSKPISKQLFLFSFHEKHHLEKGCAISPAERPMPGPQMACADVKRDTDETRVPKCSKERNKKTHVFWSRFLE